MTVLPNDFQCPQCGNIGTYQIKKVDFKIQVGNDIVIVPDLNLEECQICHEQLLDSDASRTVEAYAQQLQQGNTGHLLPVGTLYRAQP